MSVVRIPRKGDQIPALDGVRGIAVLLVMLFYSWGRSQQASLRMIALPAVYLLQ